MSHMSHRFIQFTHLVGVLSCDNHPCFFVMVSQFINAGDSTYRAERQNQGEEVVSIVIMSAE